MSDVTSGLPHDPLNYSTRVSVVDIDMPFWSMVLFLCKWALAAVPALLLLTLLGAVLMGVLEGLARSL